MQNKIINKDYIEITANSVTAGGKPTMTYRGEQIWWLKDLSNDFKKIQQIIQREYGAAPIAMRVMSSETNGEYARPGNPSPKHGKNAWVSFVFANGVETRWVFGLSYSSASDCAGHCAAGCGLYVLDYSDFRSGVFGPHADAIKKVAMSKEITNKDYIEITANSVTVGGKSTTTYRGKKIWWLKNLSNEFEKIQQIVQREYGAAPIAMRVMSSETNGEYAKPGNPSPKHGKNAWVSFVFANGIETRWVFDDSHSSASDCAAHCAAFCGNSVRLYSGFRSGVFGSVADAIKQQLQQTEKTNSTELADKATKWQNLLLHNLVSERFAH